MKMTTATSTVYTSTSTVYTSSKLIMRLLSVIVLVYIVAVSNVTAFVIGTCPTYNGRLAFFTTKLSSSISSPPPTLSPGTSAGTSTSTSTGITKQQFKTRKQRPWLVTAAKSTAKQSHQEHSMKQKQQQQQRVVAIQTPITSIEQFQQFIVTSKSSLSDSADVTAIVPPRYTVIKFHASWCKTCAKFSLKYDKLVAKHGDWIVRGGNVVTSDHPDGTASPILHRTGSLQFGSVDYSTSRDIFETLDVTKLPTVHIYDPTGTKVADIAVPPSKFEQVLLNVNHYVELYETQKLQVQADGNIKNDSGNHCVDLIAKAQPALAHSVTEAAALTPTVIEPIVTTTATPIMADTADVVKTFCQSNLYTEVAQAAIDVSYRTRSFDDANINVSEQQQHENEHRPSWWRRLPKVVRIVWNKTIASSRL